MRSIYCKGHNLPIFAASALFIEKTLKKTHTALSFGLFKAYIKYLIEVELDTSHAKFQPRSAKLMGKKRMQTTKFSAILHF